LNNDLLTLILDKDQVLEDDEKLDERKVDMLRDVFQRIEADFERYILDASIESVIQNKDTLYDVFMKMQVNTPEFQDLAVMPYSKAFQYRERNALLQNPELSVYFEHFFFVAPFPHQLSTYIQLNALIKQLSA
jgi:hypothetical protein